MVSLGAPLHVEPEGAEAAPADGSFAAAVLAGLAQPQKALPARFFYDAAGSALFEAITRLPEYYLTRAETAILTEHAAAMTAGLAEDGVLVEFGSGSSRKTELILAAAPAGTTYVPVDVSAAALTEARRRLARRFPSLDVRPLLGDFSQPIRFGADLQGRPKMGFFPGSTIGNLTPEDAVGLLRSFAAQLAPEGRLIVGVDLKKDARTLVAAYADRAGVTAAFNLNLIARINRELAAAIEPGTFRHEALYNARRGRIEMHLVSTVAQEVCILGRRFRFRAGESIHTENSYKYAIDEFQEISRAAGWRPMHVWTDAARQYSVHALAAA